MLNLTVEQWLIGGLAALMLGITKTGIPGAGILVVPLMALIFDGRLSVGATLPLLIFGDLFAVFWYQRHARWERLYELFPWIIGGMVVGMGLLWYTGAQASSVNWLNLIIGILVLMMLLISVARRIWKDSFTPNSRAGLVSAGTLAGFATTVSNSAGPIMSIYLSGMLRLPKQEFMGTSAWYFFIFNLTKLPIYLFLTWILPAQPLITRETLLFDLWMLPLILTGAFLGKYLLPRISEVWFDAVVLILSGAAALKLILDQLH
ncbi:MAG: sulfite exporter TauE/SafE family protein [Anaerolineales bacterium]|nr:sulfite exporter TauE/SafE family protein [Anaerolineales bacterium]